MKSPTPQDVKAAREAAGLTQAQAAALVYADVRAWQRWEGSGPTARQMRADTWELFRIKTAK